MEIVTLKFKDQESLSDNNPFTQFKVREENDKRTVEIIKEIGKACDKEFEKIFSNIVEELNKKLSVLDISFNPKFRRKENTAYCNSIESVISVGYDPNCSERAFAIKLTPIYNKYNDTKFSSCNGRYKLEVGITNLTQYTHMRGSIVQYKHVTDLQEIEMCLVELINGLRK